MKLVKKGPNKLYESGKEVSKVGFKTKVGPKQRVNESRF